MTPFIHRAVLMLSPLFLSFAAGCHGCGGTEPLGSSDEFAGLAVANEGTMENQASAYVWARPMGTALNCVRAPCPSSEIRGVDGSDARLVHHIDLRALSLTKNQEPQVRNRLTQMLTRGRYANWRYQGEDIVVFQVTRALNPASAAGADTPGSDGYYSLRAGDPAPDDTSINWKATPLKPGPTLTWPTLDTSALQLSPAAERTLLLEIRSKGAYVSSRLTPASATPKLTQVFRAMDAEPLPN